MFKVYKVILLRRNLKHNYLALFIKFISPYARICIIFQNNSFMQLHISVINNCKANKGIIENFTTLPVFSNFCNKTQNLETYKIPSIYANDYKIQYSPSPRIFESYPVDNFIQQMLI